MGTQKLIDKANARPAEICSVPMIDISRLNHMKSRPVVIQDIRTACRILGCFQIKNHGISTTVMRGAIEAASNFFEQSTDEINQYASGDVRKPVRYDTGSSNGCDASRNFLKQYAYPLTDWIQFWPQSPPDYREKMGRYAMEVRRVALQLMDAILEGLNLGKTFLRDELKDGIQLMTVNSYPQSSGEESTLGFAPHSDYGFITILLQSCQGLQVINREKGIWQAGLINEGTISVHVGDHLEVLSNGLYKTVVHKVMLNDEKKRISVANIHGLAMDAKVTIAKELVNEQNPRVYKDSSFREFLDYISQTDIITGTSFIDYLRIENM